MSQGTETSTGLALEENGLIEMSWRDTMADGPPRESAPTAVFVFRGCEVTLRDGTGVTHRCRIEFARCYIDTLEPIPSHTKSIRISDGISTCERAQSDLLHSGEIWNSAWE